MWTATSHILTLFNPRADGSTVGSASAEGEEFSTVIQSLGDAVGAVKEGENERVPYGELSPGQVKDDQPESGESADEANVSRITAEVSEEFLESEPDGTQMVDEGRPELDVPHLTKAEVKPSPNVEGARSDAGTEPVKVQPRRPSTAEMQFDAVSKRTHPMDVNTGLGARMDTAGGGTTDVERGDAQPTITRPEEAKLRVSSASIPSITSRSVLGHGGPVGVMYSPNMEDDTRNSSGNQNVDSLTPAVDTGKANGSSVDAVNQIAVRPSETSGREGIGEAYPLEVESMGHGVYTIGETGYSGSLGKQTARASSDRSNDPFQMRSSVHVAGTVRETQNSEVVSTVQKSAVMAEGRSQMERQESRKALGPEARLSSGSAHSNFLHRNVGSTPQENNSNATAVEAVTRLARRSGSLNAKISLPETAPDLTQPNQSASAEGEKPKSPPPAISSVRKYNGAELSDARSDLSKSSNLSKLKPELSGVPRRNAISQSPAMSWENTKAVKPDPRVRADLVSRPSMEQAGMSSPHMTSSLESKTSLEMNQERSDKPSLRENDRGPSQQPIALGSKSESSSALPKSGVPIETSFNFTGSEAKNALEDSLSEKTVEKNVPSNFAIGVSAEAKVSLAQSSAQEPISAGLSGRAISEAGSRNSMDSRGVTARALPATGVAPDGSMFRAPADAMMFMNIASSTTESPEGLALPDGSMDVPTVEVGAKNSDPREVPRTIVRTISQSVQSAVQTGGGGARADIDIELAPQELGRLRISLSASEASLSVLIVADRTDTQDLVRRHIGLLSEELRELGFQRLTVDVESGGAGTAPSRQTFSTNGSFDPSTDPAPEAEVQVPRVSGLDIRL